MPTGTTQMFAQHFLGRQEINFSSLPLVNGYLGCHQLTRVLVGKVTLCLPLNACCCHGGRHCLGDTDAHVLSETAVLLILYFAET